MTFLRKLIIPMIAIWAFAPADAQIAIWSIAPKYQKITRYFGDLYAYQENGKWGLIKPNNQIVLPAKFDYITPFVNGYALAGSNESFNYLLEAIIDESGQVSNINEKFYLPKSHQYFSDGKLVVVNKSGKYGYINPSGIQVIKCQFDNALPFKEGWGPVKQGNYMKFINETYDRNASRGILVVDFHYGEMTAIGCFSNGRAPIAYNKDFALIGTNGQKIRKLNEAEFKQIYKSNNSAPNNSSNGFSSGNDYSDYQENGKFGLKNTNGVVVTPQFDSFGDKFADGYIITSFQGKQGLLRILEGDVAMQTKVEGKPVSTLKVDRNGKFPSITVEYTLPSSLNDLSVLIDEGNGQFVNRTSSLTHTGGTSSITFSPIVAKDAEFCDIRMVVENGGIVIASDSKQFNVSYPIKLRVSAPRPDTVRANEFDTATVSSTIYNDSNKSVTVKAVWSNGKSSSVTIPAHSSCGISTSYRVLVKETRDVSVQLSTGERAISKNIVFLPFF